MSTVVTLGPVGFKPTGAYDNTREYKKLDVVIYQGSCYIAKSDSIGQLPTNTTYWELLVQKGDTGNGITSIAKTGTSGLVDTYTITYTDGTTSTFTVTNGEKGDPGEVTEEQLDEAMARANMVYNALPKVSDEGDNLTLDGTANCPMKMELKGNTEQTTYTGKNLFDEAQYCRDNATYYTYNNGIVIIDNDSRAFADINRIEVQSNTQYYVKIDNYSNNLRMQIFEYSQTDGYQKANTLTENSNFTTSSNTKYIRIKFLVDTPSTNIGHVMLSTDDIPYQPINSPSPDYPQDVRVVTGNNSVKVIGKNLYSIDNGEYNVPVYATDGTSASYQDLNVVWIKVKPNTDYSFTLLPNSKIYFVRIIECTGDKGFIYRFPNNYQPGSGVANTLTITTPNNCEWLQIATNQNQASQISQNNWEVMIEENATPSTYKPYQSQTYPINLGTIELCKIPNTSYQDIIFHAINGDSFYDTLDNATKQTLTYGKWYKHSEIGKVVLDGSNYPLYGDGGSSTDYWEYSRTGMTGGIGTQDSVKTNYFNQTTNSRIVILSNGGLYFRFPKSSGIDVSTYTLLNTWLSTHNTIVYYVLATPTNEEITDTTLISQLNAIENAVSHDTQTNIVQENYSEPFIINAECVRSLKDIFELI